MFSRVKSREERKLEVEIARVLGLLEMTEPGTPEYSKLIAVLDHLQNLREKEIPQRLSRDTMALIAANLVGLLLIIRAEHVNVLSQRALNLLTKPR